MQPPEAIRVGPYVYAVEVREDDDGGGVWGRVRYSRRAIRVSPRLTPETQRVCLLHEVMHAVNDLAALNVDAESWPKTEEQHVTTTSPLWVMVLRDNPYLIAYLTEGE